MLLVFTLHIIHVPASLLAEYPIAKDMMLFMAGGKDTVPTIISLDVVTVTLVQSSSKDSITILPFLIVLLIATLTFVAGVNISFPELADKSLFNRKIKKRDSAALSMPHPSKEKCNLILRKEKRNVNIDRKCPT